jgi:two-component system, NtrC family, response regulator AtoC
MSLKILVVDDNRSSADALARLLGKRGDEVVARYDGQTAIQHIESTPTDVVLTDLRMAPVDGFTVLRAARAQRPPIDVIVFTAHGGVQTAVKAVRMGAFDFLTKPVTLERLSERLDRLRGSAEQPTLISEADDPFIARAPRTKALLESLRRSAGVPTPVWIDGEVGTGRAFAARTLHRFGTPDAPLRVHDISRHDGWPEQGTVLLPDVDGLPDDLQRSLYRQLQYLPDEVRLVSTAQASGQKAISDGTLRSELYYRLAVVVISVPPLRERVEDIVPMFEVALEHFARRYRRPVLSVDDSTRSRLERHAWPGNVRELRNLAERATVMGMGSAVFEVEERPMHTGDTPDLKEGFSLSAYMESTERSILVEALQIAEGDRNAAGRILGVERNTLRYKLNKYGLLDR